MTLLTLTCVPEFSWSVVLYHYVIIITCTAPSVLSTMFMYLFVEGINFIKRKASVNIICQYS